MQRGSARPDRAEAPDATLAVEGTAASTTGSLCAAARPASPAEAPAAALAILDRQPMWMRPVSATVGRLWAPVYAVVMGSTAFFRAGPSVLDADVGRVTGGFVEGNTDDDLELQLGSAMPLRNLRRIWRRRGMGKAGKIIGTILWPINESLKALARMDSYDPFAHSVALYHREPAIATHELGHAQDFARRTWRTLYALARLIPPVALYQEWLASRNGIRNLRRRGLDGAIRRANRVLGGGLGSYVGGLFGSPWFLVAALLGQLLGFLLMPFGWPGRGPGQAPPRG